MIQDDKSSDRQQLNCAVEAVWHSPILKLYRSVFIICVISWDMWSANFYKYVSKGKNFSIS